MGNTTFPVRADELSYLAVLEARAGNEAQREEAIEKLARFGDSTDRIVEVAKMSLQGNPTLLREYQGMPETVIALAVSSHGAR